MVIASFCLLVENSCSLKDSTEHIEIQYSYDDITVYREMYPNRSLLYIGKEGKRTDGFVELSCYDEEYQAYIAYEKSTNTIYVLTDEMYGEWKDIDTSLWEKHPDANDLFYQISPWRKNEGYDIVCVKNSLVLEIPFNQNKDLRGKWEITYPEESNWTKSYDNWIGYVRRPAKMYNNGQTGDTDSNQLE